MVPSGLSMRPKNGFGIKEPQLWANPLGTPHSYPMRTPQRRVPILVLARALVPARVGLRGLARPGVGSGSNFFWDSGRSGSRTGLSRAIGPYLA